MYIGHICLASCLNSKLPPTIRGVVLVSLEDFGLLVVPPSHTDLLGFCVCFAIASFCYFILVVGSKSADEDMPPKAPGRCNSLCISKYKCAKLLV